MMVSHCYLIVFDRCLPVTELTKARTLNSLAWLLCETGVDSKLRPATLYSVNIHIFPYLVDEGEFFRISWLFNRDNMKIFLHKLEDF